MTASLTDWLPSVELTVYVTLLGLGPFLVVLLAGGICGVRSAAIAAAIIVLLSLAMFLFPSGRSLVLFVYSMVLPLPASIGAILGLLIAWGLWGSWPDDSP